MNTSFKKKYATIAAVLMLLTGATAVTGCTSNATTNAKPKTTEKTGTQESKKQDTKKQDTKKQETNNKTNNTESTKTEKDN